jgi:serine/threonine protein kinase
MGEVYRAIDTRLDRTVAIKVLPPILADAPQFRERFEREAKSISHFSHPNICTLHDIGREGDLDYLVMEHLEGETLAARLARGQLPLCDTLRIATEVASALDKAHGSGVIHRDLKPGNVMLVRSGSSSVITAKLLDFGLAKVAPPVALGAATVAAPTMTAKIGDGAFTVEGTLLGTLQYMAPEQIEGQSSDARTDLFAFGAVLFEMLAGRPAFQGRSPANLLGSILKDEPPLVSEVSSIAVPALDHVVQTCLAKNPHDRFQTAHDLLLQLRWIAEGSGAAATRLPESGHSRYRARVAWALAGTVVGIALGAATVVLVRPETTTPIQPVQFTIPPPDTANYLSLAVSPDGTQIAFVAPSQGVPTLFVRPLSAVAARPLPGTDRANFPFWSPDSRSIGFFAGGKLKRIALAGGPPVPVCDAPNGHGGTWNGADVIVFAPGADGPLQRVAATGGQPAAVTTLTGNAIGHRWPWFLPDATHFLYASVRPTGQRLQISSLESDATESIDTVQSPAIFAGGALLYARGGSLVGQGFDANTRAFRGEPFVVAESISISAVSFYAVFSASTTGVLVYRTPLRAPVSRLTWVDRSGKPVATAGEPGRFVNVGLTRNGRRAAASMRTEGPPPNTDVWLFDLDRPRAADKLTTDPAFEGDPIWSPDGTRVLFISNRLGPFTLFMRAANGSGTDDQVLKTPISAAAPDWSSDGGFVAFRGRGGLTGLDLWVVPMVGEGKGVPSVFLNTSFDESDPAFSPDGHWIAYNSDALGRTEVFIRPFPASAGDHQIRISDGGGWAPRWREDGRELFYVGLDGTMMTVDIGLSKAASQPPRPLFPTSIMLDLPITNHQYDVSRDGSRFLLRVPVEKVAPVPITVMTGWQPAVRK